MKGVNEHHRREVGVNLTGGRVNAVEISQKILGTPSLDDLVNEFRMENGLPSQPTDPRYVVTHEPEMKRVEDTYDGVDQTIIDDIPDPPSKTMVMKDVQHQLTYREGKGGYEVSTKGDRRFSALVARLSDGYTIEEYFQLDVKKYGVLGRDHWKLGKGKPPLVKFEGDELYQAYLALWQRWASENPTLIEELRGHADEHNGLLSDCFAHGKPVNQARALSDILQQTNHHN